MRTPIPGPAVQQENQSSQAGPTGKEKADVALLGSEIERQRSCPRGS